MVDEIKHFSGKMAWRQNDGTSKLKLTVFGQSKNGL
jgi:hypothetical protein